MVAKLPEYLTNPSLGEDIIALLAQYALEAERDALAMRRDLVAAAGIRKVKRWVAQTATYLSVDNPLDNAEPLPLRPVERDGAA